MSTRSGCQSLRPRRGHKERSKNFTELEKRTVLELIARHRDVLRQGRSNNATNRSKQLVWSRICEEVNARCCGERPRTPAQVKMWYENYKKKCKMRAHECQTTPSRTEAPGILDGMLWQSLHPLDVKEEKYDAISVENLSSKDEDCTPVNMTNGRLSSTNDSDDTSPNVLEPHVQIIPQASPTPPPPARAPFAHAPPAPLAPLSAHPLQALEQARLQQSLLQKLHELSEHEAPLNLSEERRADGSPPRRPSRDCPAPCDEERLYFAAKRQHALWEHEAKMKILGMELKQKEEIFSLQKQLFLIELRLKMDFLEKASGK